MSRRALEYLEVGKVSEPRKDAKRTACQQGRHNPKCSNPNPLLVSAPAGCVTTDYWRVRASMGMGANQPLRKFVGTASTQAAARRQLQEQIDSFRKQCQRSQEKEAAGEFIAFATAANEWLESKTLEGISAGTEQRYLDVTTRVLGTALMDSRGRHVPKARADFTPDAEPLAQVDVRRLKPPFLKNVLKDIPEVRDGTLKGVSYVAHAHQILVAVLDWCVSEGYIDGVTPMHSIAQPKIARNVESHATRPLQPEEWGAVRQAIVKQPRHSPNLLAVLDLLSGTGLRISEALALRKVDARAINRPVAPELYVAGRILGRMKSVTPPGETTSYRAQGLKEDTRPSAYRIVANPPEWVTHVVNEQLAKLDADAQPDSLLFQTRVGTPVAPNNIRRALRKTVRDLEEDTSRLTKERNAIDRAMFDPSGAEPRFAKLSMSDLNRRRAEVQAKLETAEAKWLEASEALEMAGAQAA